MARTPIRPRDRFEILQRDGFTCRYCGAQPGETELQIDHIVPIAKGGTNSLLNLITSCRLCNAGKGSNVAERVPISYDVLAYTETLAAMEEAMSAKVGRILEARKKRFQEVVNMICWTCNLERFNRRHAQHIMALVDDYGAELVEEWLAAAACRDVKPDNIVKYVYGCVRKYANTGDDDANA